MNEEDTNRRIDKCLGLIPSHNYFNIYNYIADQQLIDVKLAQNAPLAGLFDNNRSNDGELHIPKNSYMKVTLAAAALMKENEFAYPVKPKILSENGVFKSVQERIDGETCCILNLNEISPVFFEWAVSIAYLVDDEKLFGTVYQILRTRTTMLNHLMFSTQQERSVDLQAKSKNQLLYELCIENLNKNKYSIETLFDSKYRWNDDIGDPYIDNLIKIFEKCLTLSETKYWKKQQKLNKSS